MPGSNPAERAAVYRRDERDARAAAFATIRRRSGLPTSAAARTTSRARSTAGRSSTAPRETEKIDEMERLIEWLPAHLPPAGPVRLVHGDYRLDNMILHADRAARARGARLGAVDARRSARRLHLSLMQWHMPHADTGAGTGSLVGLDLAALGIPSLVRLRRCLRGAHRARSAAASGGLSRLQFLPPRRDPAGHRRPRARRHRDQRERAGARRRWCGRWPRPPGRSRARRAPDERT